MPSVDRRAEWRIDPQLFRKALSGTFVPVRDDAFGTGYRFSFAGDAHSLAVYPSKRIGLLRGTYGGISIQNSEDPQALIPQQAVVFRYPDNQGGVVIHADGAHREIYIPTHRTNGTLLAKHQVPLLTADMTAEGDITGEQEKLIEITGRVQQITTNTFPDGTPLCYFQVVVTHKDRATTHRVVAIREAAREIAAKGGLRDGQEVSLTGEPRTRQLKKDPTRTITEIHLRSLKADGLSVGKAFP